MGALAAAAAPGLLAGPVGRLGGERGGRCSRPARPGPPCPSDASPARGGPGRRRAGSRPVPRRPARHTARSWGSVGTGPSSASSQPGGSRARACWSTRRRQASSRATARSWTRRSASWASIQPRCRCWARRRMPEPLGRLVGLPGGGPQRVLGQHQPLPGRGQLPPTPPAPGQGRDLVGGGLLVGAGLLAGLLGLGRPPGGQLQLPGAVRRAAARAAGRAGRVRPAAPAWTAAARPAGPGCRWPGSCCRHGSAPGPAAPPAPAPPGPDGGVPRRGRGVRGRRSGTGRSAACCG